MKKERRDLTGTKQYAYVYLLHRFFNGRLNEMAAALELPELKKDIPEWEKSFKDLVMNRIADEGRRGAPKDEQPDVPSIKSIKEKILRRCDALINATDDPARIAQVYKILSEFEAKDEKKAISVVDAINESIQKPGSKLAQLERSIAPETKVPGKRGRGRPRKIRPWELKKAPDAPAEGEAEISQNEKNEE